MYLNNVESLSFRKLLRAICMTACDLSACTKPWEIQLEIVKVIYQEFYAEVRMIINYCKYNLSNYGKAVI